MAESTSSSASGDHPVTSENLCDHADQVPDTVEQPIVSLLSRLRAPAPSELSRKRKCVSNPSEWQAEKPWEQRYGAQEC